MILKRTICGFSFIIMVTVSVPASAETSLVYEHYLSEGIKAYERHDDEEAIRDFKRAHLINPSAREPGVYLLMIQQRQSPAEHVPDRMSVYQSYREYWSLFSQGKEALGRRDYRAANEAFLRMQALDPQADLPAEFLELTRRKQAEERASKTVRNPSPSAPPAKDKYSTTAKIEAINTALDRYEAQTTRAAEEASARYATVQGKPSVAAGRMTRAVVAGIAPGQVEGSATTVASGTSLYVAKGEKPATPEIITLTEDMRSAQPSPELQLEMGSSVILEGQNLQRFLIIDEGFIQAKLIGRDQILVTAVKRGSTFLHIWDQQGRWTFRVDSIFPRTKGEIAAGPPALLEHGRPFQFRYSNDWTAYYYGQKDTGLRRRSVNYQQDIGGEGDTPFGELDSSASMSGLGTRLVVPFYTLGLSHVPIPGPSDVNLRVFDASRTLSPLTMSGAYLRGAFADIGFFENAVALSISHGRVQPSFGYFLSQYSTTTQSYLNAYKITVVTPDKKNRLGLNYGEGYGTGRQPFLTKKAYSIEGEHKFDKAAINAELARDTNRTASIAGWRWTSARLASAVNFRNIEKDYTTLTNFPSGQGEIGATWSANASTDRFDLDANADIYRNRQYFNPNDPSAWNYDTDTHVRVPINVSTWSDTTVRYVTTPGELSPRRYASVDSRVTKSFPVWNSRSGTYYAGGSYQKSHVAQSVISDYDRRAVIVGMNVPFTRELSAFANYEYSWLHEPLSGLNSHPNVLNTGLNYNKMFTDQLSGNMGVTYRKEQDVRGTNSFLAGEDSVGGSAGLAYNPSKDISYFVDGQVRKVWALKPENPSYYDIDIRFGMRILWGAPLHWDPQGVIAGIVFKDRNNNGRWDNGEEGLEGVKVLVGDKEVVTDKDGRYSLSIRAKRVVVAPSLETLPPGYMVSNRGSSKVEVLQSRTRRVDFGVTTQTGIYGIVFADLNGNGVPDRGDKFLRGVKLFLDNKTAIMSDSQGVFYFENIAPGKHVIAVDISTVPIEYIPEVKLKNEVFVTEGTNFVFHVPMKSKEQGTGDL